MVSESRATWATSVPILVFLCLNVLELGPMCTTDRQSDVRQKHRLMPPPYVGGGIINSSAMRLAGYVTVTSMTFDKQSNTC